MNKQNGPVIDMTPDGNFVQPAQPTLGVILARLAGFAALLIIAAVAFWMALFIIPILIILAIAAFALTRPQIRRPMGW
jgi:hypothetical protein